MADERPVNDMGTILRKVRTMQKSNTARAQGHYDRWPRASVRRRALGRGIATMAATNKCLAQSNKSRTRGETTKKRRRQRGAIPLARRQVGETRCGVSAAGISPPIGGAKSR